MSNTDIQIGSNRDMNKDHKKLPPLGSGKAEGVAHDAPKMMKDADNPVKDHLLVRYDNLKMFTGNHNDDKLAITFLIVAAELIAYPFW